MPKQLGPVQSTEAACPLYVAPQPVLEALWQQYAGTLVLEAPRPVERQGPSRGWGSGDTARWYPLAVYRGAMPTSGPGSVASAEVVSYEAIRVAWLQLRMPYDPGASETFSGTTFLPLKELRQFSTAWARSSVRRAVILTESNSTQRKEVLCTGESLLFSQLTRSPNWLRCWSTKSLWSPNYSLDWARISQSSLYCHAWPSNGNRRNGLCHGRIETWK